MGKALASNRGAEGIAAASRASRTAPVIKWRATLLSVAVEDEVGAAELVRKMDGDATWPGNRMDTGSMRWLLEVS